MGFPRFLLENFFDPRLFPSHVVSANGETTDHEAWRVGSARRERRNNWTPGAAGASWIRVDCNRARYADMLVVDRNSNLAGHSVALEVSNNGFASIGTVFSGVVPDRAAAGARLSTPGVFTEEGAWLLTFPGRIAVSWRLSIPAMAGGLEPEIGGLWIGKSWVPPHKPVLPWDDEPRNLEYQEFVSSSFWVGSNRPASRREIDGWVLRLEHADYAEARYHWHGIYHRGGFAWVVPDEEQAERAGLFRPPRGVKGIPATADWFGRQYVFSGVEEQPSQEVALG